MNKLVLVLTRKENLAFILGVATVFLMLEFEGSQIFQAVICLIAVFGLMPLIKRYGH